MGGGGMGGDGGGGGRGVADRKWNTPVKPFSSIDLLCYIFCCLMPMPGASWTSRIFGSGPGTR